MSVRLSKNEAIVVKRYKTDYKVAMQLLKGAPIKVEEVLRKEGEEYVTVEEKEVRHIIKDLFARGILYNGFTEDFLLEKDGSLIEFIDTPTVEQQLQVLRKSVSYKRHIKNLCSEAIPVLLENYKDGYYDEMGEIIDTLSDSELTNYLIINPKLAVLIKEERWTQEMVTEYLRKMVHDNRKELIDDYLYRIRIPEKFRDKTYYRSYCMVDGYNYSKIPEEKRDEYIIPKLIRYTLDNGTSYVGTLWMFQYLPENLKTEELCLECCLKHFACVAYLPKKFHTVEFYKKLISEGQYSFLDEADSDVLTEDIIIEVINNSYKSHVPSIPKKLMTQKVAMALAGHPRALEVKIPKKFLTKEWYEEHARLTGNLAVVPKQHLTEELCIAAAKANYWSANSSIPDELRTENFWKEITESMSFRHLSDVPEEYYSDDLFVRYGKRTVDVMKELPEQYYSEELFLRFIREISSSELGLAELYSNILKASDSKVVEEEVLKMLRDNKIENSYWRLCVAKAFKQAPRELIEEFVTTREDAIYLNGLTKEDIERHLEIFPESVLYIPDEEPEENTAPIVTIPTPTINILPDVSVFEQMTIWDILTA